MELFTLGRRLSVNLKNSGIMRSSEKFFRLAIIEQVGHYCSASRNGRVQAGDGRIIRLSTTDRSQSPSQRPTS
jgi:hypothetical protein